MPRQALTVTFSHWLRQACKLKCITHFELPVNKVAVFAPLRKWNHHTFVSSAHETLHVGIQSDVLDLVASTSKLSS